MGDNASFDATRAVASELALGEVAHSEPRLVNELRLARERQAALELEVLNSRDHAAGRAAEIGEWRYRLIRQAAIYEQRLCDQASHEANHRAHIARLETALQTASRQAQQPGGNVGDLHRELLALRASTTWRLGRVLMLPIRILKRVVRR